MRRLLFCLPAKPTTSGKYYRRRRVPTSQSAAYAITYPCFLPFRSLHDIGNCDVRHVASCHDYVSLLKRKSRYGARHHHSEQLSEADGTAEKQKFND